MGCDTPMQRYRTIERSKRSSIFARREEAWQQVGPETAPFKDRETGTRWTLAGRAVDGPLKGKELQWVRSIQCHWYAWVAEYPATSLYAPAK